MNGVGGELDANQAQIHFSADLIEDDPMAYGLMKQPLMGASVPSSSRLFNTVAALIQRRDSKGMQTLSASKPG
ncbi:unnamed protein product [Linum tenue]|uniref:Uncharacterized protein n=1 Tax=Linum tenue TaxID=586396 RepID=A0AAV0GZ77_9ROSI|nr:unnamed protein product [Linum tenue]